MLQYRHQDWGQPEVEEWHYLLKVTLSVLRSHKAQFVNHMLKLYLFSWIAVPQWESCTGHLHQTWTIYYKNGKNNRTPCFLRGPYNRLRRFQYWPFETELLWLHVLTWITQSKKMSFLLPHALQTTPNLLLITSCVILNLEYQLVSTMLPLQIAARRFSPYLENTCHLCVIHGIEDPLV